jgi:hypothetical protein
MQMKLLGITNVDFGMINQRLIKLSTSDRYWKKMGVLWCNASDIYKFQESLRFSSGLKIIQYSH